MTDNLQNKFTALQTQLANQHTELMNQLAAIASAIGAPAPGGQTTLADLLAVLNDIHTDTQSQDAKLLLIRNAVRGDLEATPPTGELESIQWLLYRLIDAINPTWPRPTSIPVQPLLQLLYTQLSPMTASWWQTILGISTSGTDNVLDWLALNYAATVANATALPPTAGVGGTCTAPITSRDVIYSYNGRNYAMWFEDELPTDVTYGNTLGLQTGIELSAASRSGNWDGISVYVYSKAASTWSIQPGYAEEHPTNKWIALSPNVNYPVAISVAGGCDIRAYLCTDAAATLTLTAVLGQIYHPNVGTVSRYVIDWSSTAFTSSTEQPDPNGSFTWDVNAVCITDLYGYTFRRVSGTGNIRILGFNGTDIVYGGYEGVVLETEIAWWHHTTGIVIDAYHNDMTTFTIEVIPPA